MTIHKGYDFDPQLVEVLIGLVAAMDKIPLDQRSPEQARMLLKQRTAFYQSLGSRREDDHDVYDQYAPRSGGVIPIRIYRPEGTADMLPALLYFHGGAWMRGDLDTHDDLAGKLASEVGCVVISVDNRLAPEHKFPAAIEDSYAVLSWVSNRANKLNIDKGDIAICGDSSGGNIAATLILMTRDRLGPALVFQLLMYPVLNLSSFETQSYIEHSDKVFGLTRDKMIWACVLYLAKQDDRVNMYPSPLLAKNLAVLPTMEIITAKYDSLRVKPPRKNGAQMEDDKSCH